jgi:GTP-binding protein
VSAESDDPVRDYHIVRKELESYNPALTKKTEYVFLTKSDMVPPETLKSTVAAFKKNGIKIVPISLLDTSIEDVKKILNTLKG